MAECGLVPFEWDLRRYAQSSVQQVGTQPPEPFDDGPRSASDRIAKVALRLLAMRVKLERHGKVARTQSAIAGVQQTPTEQSVTFPAESGLKEGQRGRQIFCKHQKRERPDIRLPVGAGDLPTGILGNTLSDHWDLSQRTQTFRCDLPCFFAIANLAVERLIHRPHSRVFCEFAFAEPFAALC